MSAWEYVAWEERPCGLPMDEPRVVWRPTCKRCGGLMQRCDDQWLCFECDHAAYDRWVVEGRP